MQRCARRRTASGSVIVAVMMVVVVVFLPPLPSSSSPSSPSSDSSSSLSSSSSVKSLQDSLQATVPPPAPLPPSLKEISEESCRPRHDLVFLKTHKCASSTTQRIFLRYGKQHGLTQALP
ncbi:hypothetical protein O3P69_009788 [Scylla paramamosain]|uniref:Uncharacterized protein n=1 Tax=Scylla paramamosain TaxID=85552 RepID=A0AAW0SLX2_SCYPA